MKETQQGLKINKFEVFVNNLNANPQFCVAFSRHSNVGRYRTRMAAYIQMRNADEKASGVMREYSEVEKLLEDMSPR